MIAPRSEHPQYHTCRPAVGGRLGRRIPLWPDRLHSGLAILAIDAIDVSVATSIQPAAGRGKYYKSLNIDNKTLCILFPTPP